MYKEVKMIDHLVHYLCLCQIACCTFVRIVPISVLYIFLLSQINLRDGFSMEKDLNI